MMYMGNPYEDNEALAMCPICGAEEPEKFYVQDYSVVGCDKCTTVAYQDDIHKDDKGYATTIDY